jgi:hypothetical protein
LPPLGRQCDVAFALVVLIGNAGVYTTCYSGRSAFNGFLVPAGHHQ